MMAGFSRLRLPHLIHAAVSSSAPWHAKVDMTEYNDRVGAALANEAVGGSIMPEDCGRRPREDQGPARVVAAAANGTRQILQLLQPAGPRKCADAPRLGGVWGRRRAGPEQRSELDGSGGNPSGLCSVLLAANASSVDALATLSARQRGGRCVDASLSQNFEDDGSDVTSWPWQTCAEFGFYQTCEVGSQCPLRAAT